MPTIQSIQEDLNRIDLLQYKIQVNAQSENWLREARSEGEEVPVSFGNTLSTVWVPIDFLLEKLREERVEMEDTLVPLKSEYGIED